MFLSSHYVGVNVRVRNGEAWKKVLGPVFIYLNSRINKTKPNTLWEDAKTQVILFFSTTIELDLLELTLVDLIR